MSDLSAKITAPSHDLRHYLYVLWRRKWIVILSVILITAAVFGITNFLLVPQYQSSSELLHRRSGLDKVLLGSDVLQDSINQPERDLQTAAELVLSPEVVQAVKIRLGDRLNGRDPATMVEVNLVSKADILRITATDSDPRLAADVANSFAEEYIAWRRQVDQDVLQRARASVEVQMGALTSEQQQSETYTVLRDKLETIQLIEFIQTGNLEIVKEAIPAEAPSSPKPFRSSAIGLFLSLVGGMGLAVMINQFDTKIRNIDEIRNEVDKPILATIPDAESVSDKRSLSTINHPSGPSAEAYRILKTNLGYADPDRNLKSILVTSTESGEGKSTLVANLAVTWARAGKRVIVLDLDLRRPKIHRYLDLGNNAGVTNVMAGEYDLKNVVQAVSSSDLVPASQEGTNDTGPAGGSLNNNVKPIYCVTSGPIPPNPGELVVSEKMTKLITEACHYADIVIIDSPPLGIVADAAGLASKVDGIVMVTKIGQTSKGSLHTINDFIESVPGNVLGLVLTNARAGRGYDYKYHYYQKQYYA